MINLRPHSAKGVNKTQYINIMKIEITNEGEYFHIYKQGEARPFRNMRANINLFAFYEDDILNLLGEKKYKKFELGQYVFDIPANHIKLITGERSAQTRNELLMYNN